MQAQDRLAASSQFRNARDDSVCTELSVTVEAFSIGAVGCARRMLAFSAHGLGAL